MTALKIDRVDARQGIVDFINNLTPKIEKMRWKYRVDALSLFWKPAMADVGRWGWIITWSIDVEANQIIYEVMMTVKTQDMESPRHVIN